VSDQDEKEAEPTQMSDEQSDVEASAVPEAGTGETAGPDASNDESTEPGEMEPEDERSLEEMVGQLQEDVLAARDASLRAQADAQNVKRRAEQDVEKARKFALERFASDLLPVVDNLERSMEAASGGDEVSKSIAEGVELTLKSLLDVMKKYNIEVVDPASEPFDPQLHQAMSMVENPDVEPNTVIAVMQKGYTLNGRLIRPAMVMVSKAAG
jgi:molecular chaperone GrpE